MKSREYPEVCNDEKRVRDIGRGCSGHLQPTWQSGQQPAAGRKIKGKLGNSWQKHQHSERRRVEPLCEPGEQSRAARNNKEYWKHLG